MKLIKRIILFTLVIIGTFSFTGLEKKDKNLDLKDLDVIALLSKQQLECRPSSKFMYYVDTEILKKSRGYSLIKANVYIYERATGKYSLLATENIFSPFQKDAILNYEIAESNCNTKQLENGDKVIGNKENSKYCFNELIAYKTVYNSYITSRNKLLEK